MSDENICRVFVVIMLLLVVGRLTGVIYPIPSCETPMGVGDDVQCVYSGEVYYKGVDTNA